jgi:hypothetical protein
MIDMLEQKIQNRPEVKNVRAVAALIEDPDDARLQEPGASGPPKRFDLIVMLSLQYQLDNRLIEAQRLAI